jgi:phosphoribosylamine--glycine ligase
MLHRGVSGGDKMKFLIVGEGAREHAIAQKASETYDVYSAMGILNPGLKRIAREYALTDTLSPQKVSDYADKIRPEIIFIGSEESLFAGVSDELRKRGHVVIGASSATAMIEKSKAFMRRLMENHNMEGRLRFKTFASLEHASKYIEEFAGSIAIKPARQAGGKGVKVIADMQAYLKGEKADVKRKHAQKIVEEKMSGDLNEQVLIEEKVEGVEYTLQCFTDGRHVVPLPLVQDHPHAYEEDIGPETGGMGSISGKGNLLPFIRQEEYDRSQKLIEKVLDAIHEETGERYVGVISGQFMLTDKWGPTIIEFYSRLGDPEASNIMPLLQNFPEICEGVARQNVSNMKAKCENVCTVVKCVAPKGYPNERNIGRGHPIVVDEKILDKYGARVFFGSAFEENGKIFTAGSRVCEVFSKGETIEEAGMTVERAMTAIHSPHKLFWRQDIATPELLRKRITTADLARDIYNYRLTKGLIGKTIDWLPGIGRIET